MLRDYDSYASLVGDDAAVTVPIAADIFSQNTRLMPGATHAAGRETDVKTEVMANQLSQLTAVKAAAGDTAASSKRRFGVVAAGLATIVVLGSIAGGAYLYDPTLFNHTETAIPEPAAVVQPVDEVKVNASNSTAAAAATTPETDTNSRTATTSDVTSATKPVDQSKNNRTQAQTNTPAQPETPKIVVDGETIYMGNTKILPDGRIETPDRIIDENGVRPRTPPVPPPGFDPQVMPDLRHLTPEQRRKVLRALRRNGIIVRPSPTPN
jgi:hypothetical protein